MTASWLESAEAAAPSSHPRRAFGDRSSRSLDTCKRPQEALYLQGLTVADDCDPTFHREVYPDGQLATHACVKRGAVTVTNAVGNDGRSTGEAWIGHIAVPTPRAHAKAIRILINELSGIDRLEQPR